MPRGSGLAESDRPATTAAMLASSLGAHVEEPPEGPTVHGGGLRGGAVSAARPPHCHGGGGGGVRLHGTGHRGLECTNKSYPRFGGDFNESRKRREQFWEKTFAS